MKYAPPQGMSRGGRLDVYDMTDKELRRLSRIELLNMLVESGRAKEALEQQLQEMHRQLTAFQDQSAVERAQMAAAQEQLMRTQRELTAQQQKTADVNKELRSMQQQLESARVQLTAAQQALEDERAQSALQNRGTDEKDQQLTAAQEEIVQLRTQKEELRAQLNDRTIIKENAGTLADAAAQINGVFEAAQNTAAQYLENIERMKTEQEEKCRRLAEQARAHAREIIAQAEAACEEMKQQTRRKCEELQYIAEEKARSKWNSLSRQLDQISLEIRNSMSGPAAAGSVDEE
jgi:chromosome segregation ATPase